MTPHPAWFSTAPAPRTPRAADPPSTAARRLLVPCGLLAAVGAAFGYVGLVDPNQPGHYPVCPLRQCTGLWCPGCGGLRCAHALVHGDLPAALADNGLAVAGFALFAVLWVAWAVRSLQGRPFTVALGPVQLRVAGVVIMLFTVVRNLPTGGWLHP